MQFEASQGRKSVSATRVTYRSLLPDVDQTSPGCGARGGSAMCHVRVTPLQCLARLERKNVSALRVSALLPDFDQNCSSCGA
jgi:hypothetical protein